MNAASLLVAACMTCQTPAKMPPAAPAPIQAAPVAAPAKIADHSAPALASSGCNDCGSSAGTSCCSDCGGGGHKLFGKLKGMFNRSKGCDDCGGGHSIKAVSHARASSGCGSCDSGCGNGHGKGSGGILAKLKGMFHQGKGDCGCASPCSNCDSSVPSATIGIVIHSGTAGHLTPVPASTHGAAPAQSAPATATPSSDTPRQMPAGDKKPGTDKPAVPSTDKPKADPAKSGEKKAQLGTPVSILAPASTLILD